MAPAKCSWFSVDINANPDLTYGPGELHPGSPMIKLNRTEAFQYTEPYVEASTGMPTNLRNSLSLDVFEAEPIIDKYGLTLLVEHLTTSWYTAPEGVRVNPLCRCDFERTLMFDAKDPEVQCKGCMTCRKVTPTFMKHAENQVV